MLETNYDNVAAASLGQYHRLKYFGFPAAVEAVAIISYQPCIAATHHNTNRQSEWGSFQTKYFVWIKENLFAFLPHASFLTLSDTGGVIVTCWQL